MNAFQGLWWCGEKLESEHRFPDRPSPSFKDIIDLIRYCDPAMELLHPLRKTRHQRASDASLTHPEQAQYGRWKTDKQEQQNCNPNPNWLEPKLWPIPSCPQHLLSLWSQYPPKNPKERNLSAPVGCARHGDWEHKTQSTCKLTDLYMMSFKEKFTFPHNKNYALNEYTAVTKCKQLLTSSIF